ncbi:lysine transporter LysE [Enterobacterales bacterium CwR94]|nr:lysine transporter LysE [Enterobacterales bacterium CwR94]
MNGMLLGSWVLCVAVLLITPGPVVMMLITTAAQQGTRPALRVLAGANVASLILMAAALVLLRGMIALPASGLTLLTFLGAGYIGWLAWQGMKTSTVSTQQYGQQDASGLRRGLLVGIANPKDILFFAALLPQFIQITPIFMTSALILMLVWLCMDLLIMSGWILIVRHVFSPRCYPLLIRLSSLALLLLALSGLLYQAHAFFILLKA